MPGNLKSLVECPLVVLRRRQQDTGTGFVLKLNIVINCNIIKQLIVMLLYQPHIDFAGIFLTPHELWSPPSAVSAAAEREGGNRRHDLDNFITLESQCAFVIA